MFVLRFETDNDAFTGLGRNYEMTQVLKDVAAKVAMGKMNGNIRDINGNTIGHFEYSK